MPRYYLCPNDDLQNMNWDRRRTNQTEWKNSEQPWMTEDQRFMTKNGSGNKRFHMQTAELQYFYETSKRLGPGNYANLGTYRGCSAMILALGLKENGHKGMVWAVDWYLQKHGEWSAEKLHEYVDGVGLEDYIAICKGFVHEWAIKARGNEFNFIFHDGKHSYESVKAEFELWHPLLKVGGEFAFHDTNMTGVDQVIQELDPKIWTPVDHVWKIKSFRKTQ